MKKILYPCMMSFALLFIISHSEYATAASVWDKSLEDYPGKKEITVYRSPTCGCCKSWVSHLNTHGFKVTDIEVGDIDAVKEKYHVPQNMSSCHTAIVDGYIIEGHVPADDIKRLLKTRVSVAGLSVPEMPIGTPGMEQNNRKDPFKVFTFQENGKSDVFREYKSY